MTKYFYFLMSILILSCQNFDGKLDSTKEKQSLDEFMIKWHKNVAEANLDDYFEMMGGNLHLYRN